MNAGAFPADGRCSLGLDTQSGYHEMPWPANHLIQQASVYAGKTHADGRGFPLKPEQKKGRFGDVKMVEIATQMGIDRFLLLPNIVINK